MKIVWQVDEADIATVKEFVERNGDNPFVNFRIATNLSDEKPPVTIDRFWEIMIGCLLTTQQKSGPKSAVGRFIQTKPFPLCHSDCTGRKNLALHVTEVFTRFGGLRRTTNIGLEAAANSLVLEQLWGEVLLLLERVRLNPIKATERVAARFIADHFQGFGPKQSRNLLQGLGLSRHEIPIDSRITRWLNEFGFPVRLRATALGDHDYYEFVSDGFQHLCEACDIIPCVLDAIIFAYYDKGAWSKENVIW